MADAGPPSPPPPSAPPSTSGGAAGSASGKSIGSGVNLGAVSASNDLLRTARASIASRTVTGGIAGRDIVIHQYGGPTPAAVGGVQPISASQLEPVVEAFVSPEGFTELVNAVGAGRRITVLMAAPGAGAETASLALLRELGVEHLFRLDPQRPIRSWLSESFVDSGGYVLTGVAENHLREMTAFDLDGIQAQLEIAQARLIIVVPTTFVSIDPAVAASTVRLGKPPPVETIVRRHLAWRMGPGHDPGLLDDPDIAVIIKQLGDNGYRCSDGARLAMLICDCVHRTGAVDAAWLGGQLREIAADEVNAWFAGLEDTSLRSFAIALAVLNGLSFETVASAASWLRWRLEEPVATRTTDPDIRLVTPLPREADPFRDTRAARLQRLRATVTRTTLPAWFGTTPTQVMSYISPEYAPAVLNRVWEEYDEARPVLIDFLRALGREPSEAVRVWAATTVGTLATRAFEYVLNQIIWPWAEGGQRERECAAIALNIPATTGDLDDQVRSVVRGWSTGDTVGLKATAARAYGSSLGQTQPGEAISSLEYLADTGDNDVANAVGRSLAELMDWNASLTPAILTSLVHWIEGREPDRVTSAHVAFLVVARDLVHEAQSVGADDRPVQWPTLLHLAHTDPRLRATIAGLWHVSLNGPLHEDAYHIFSGWAIMVEPDLRPREALASLAADIGSDDRTRNILTDLAARWTTGKNLERTPRTAAAVLAAITP